MAKITSISWVEKDDPMFTGKFTVSSNNKKDKSKAKQNDKSNKAEKKELTKDKD